MEDSALLTLGKNTRRTEAPGWLDAARRGESWALEAFYAEHQALVYALCRRLLDRPEDVEDAMQATFTKAFRALPSFRGDCAPKTWIYHIATNEAIALLRTRRPDDVPLDEELPSPDGAPAAADRMAVRSALSRVKPHHRAVLVLRYWEDLAYEEIGRVLGLPLPVVRMRLARAKAEFKRYYGAEP